MVSPFQKPLTEEERKRLKEWLIAAEPYDTSVIELDAEPRDIDRTMATIAKDLLEADDKLKEKKE